MPLFHSKSRRLLGVYLSSQAIQLVELSKKGQNYCVENYVTHPLQQPENTRAQAKLLHQLCQTTKIKTKRIVTAVPDALVLRKIMPVSTQLSRNNIEDLVALEVSKLLPQETETLYYDFQWHPPISDDSAVHDLVILAARRVDVEKRKQWLTAAGFRLQAVDVVSQALYRVLAHIQTSLPATIAWIYLEETQIHLYVFHLGHTLFAHSEPLIKNTDHPMSHYIMSIQRSLHMFQIAYPSYILSYAIVSSTDASFETIPLSAALHLEIQSIHPFEILPLAKHLDKSVLLSRSNQFLIALGLALRV